MSQNKKIVFVILACILFSTFFLVNRYVQNTTTSEEDQKIRVTTLEKTFYSESADLDEKLEAYNTLKEESLDSDNSNTVRLEAGELISNAFLEYNGELTHALTPGPTTMEEVREVYEYAKSLNALGDSDRNSLITAYLGLRYFSDEVDEQFITDLLDSHIRYVTQNGEQNLCNGYSKFSSILYLMHEKKQIDLSERYGAFDTYFNKAFYGCSGKSKTYTALLWLVALSTSEKTEENNRMADKLIQYLTRTNPKDVLMEEIITDVYFNSPFKEGMVSLIDAIVGAYPAFAEYVAKLRTTPLGT